MFPPLISLAKTSRRQHLDQDLSLQRAALKAVGCTVIRTEKASGYSRKGRSELETLMDFLRRGDTLCVTRIDRLARSLRDLQNIAHELQETLILAPTMRPTARFDDG